MFKKLFGAKKRQPSEAQLEAWQVEKITRLERALGNAAERTLHVIVADPKSGPFNTMFFYNHLSGTGLATIQLARLEGDGPSNAQYDMFEMVPETRSDVAKTCLTLRDDCLAVCSASL
jgi:hypothetical protein